MSHLLFILYIYGNNIFCGYLTLVNTKYICKTKSLADKNCYITLFIPITNNESPTVHTVHIWKKHIFLLPCIGKY